MTVRLQELFDQARAQKHDITLIAGRAGLNQPVRWVHMVENEEIAGFLEGQEIAFTTGIGLDSQESLTELVASTYRCGASGIVVNVGPFIHQISPNAIRFCDEHDFPLFRVPWNEHMAQIMHQFSLSITLSEKYTRELGVALKNAIEWPANEELYLDTLEQNGFGKDWNYSVGVMDCVSTVPTAECALPHVADARIDMFRDALESLITQHQWQIAQFAMDHRIVMVFARYNADEISTITREMLSACMAIAHDDERMFIGIGKITKSARCIGKSYRQGLTLERLQKHRGKSETPFLYDDAGVDKLLLSVGDPEILRDYYNHTVGPLVEYDKVNNGDLTETLRNYLMFSGSIKETSERMYVHRNTVSYKLGKIQDILDVNLSDFAVRESLSIGLHVRELLDC